MQEIEETKIFYKGVDTGNARNRGKKMERKQAPIC